MAKKKKFPAKKAEKKAERKKRSKPARSLERLRREDIYKHAWNLGIRPQSELIDEVSRFLTVFMVKDGKECSIALALPGHEQPVYFGRSEDVHAAVLNALQEWRDAVE